MLKLGNWYGTCPRPVPGISSEGAARSYFCSCRRVETVSRVQVLCVRDLRAETTISGQSSG
eukprot:1167411-Rhodomonas_salina.1